MYDFVDNASTLLGSESTLTERGEALFNMVSPVSTKEAKTVAKTLGVLDDARDAGKVVKGGAGKITNPYGAKGKPDHQAKVEELRGKAEKENPGMKVVTEKKIQAEGSNRRPDVQVIDPKTGKTVKIYETERHPESKRNQQREAEYKRLKIPYETHKVGGKK